MTPWPKPARAALPFLAFGGASIVAGGMVAAVTAHAPTEHATWASAYLVLVAGVAQMILGAGQAWAGDRLPSLRRIVAEMVAWNLGNAAVVAGTVSGLTVLVFGGGLLLVVALVLLLVSARGPGRVRWLLAAHRVVAAIVAISIPVGLVLAQLRSP